MEKSSNLAGLAMRQRRMLLVEVRDRWTRAWAWEEEKQK
jgi:hypothetical protein